MKPGWEDCPGCGLYKRQGKMCEACNYGQKLYAVVSKPK